MRCQALALTAAVTAATIQLGGTATAQETTAWQEGPVFNDPLGSSEQQHAIRTRLVGLTDSALPGSTIRVAVYHMWEDTVVDALVNAHSRGVNVQIMLDESSVANRPDNTAFATLLAELGSDRTRPSFVGLCPVDRSCLGDPQLGPSIMHHKFWLFSAVEGATDVVVQTTVNNTPSASTKFFNDALVLPDNSAMHGAYAAYFRDLAAMDWRNWKYRSVTAEPFKSYYFPRAGTTTTTDTVRNVMDNIQCTWQGSDGVTQRTRIRVAMFKLTRQAVADKIIDLKRSGCLVSVLYAQTDSAASQGGNAGTWETLHPASGGPTVRCYNDDRDPDNPGERLTTPYIVHNKYLTIDGRYLGNRQKLTFTGSHNYTGPALRKNDEALVKVDDDAVHDAYVGAYNRIITVAWPGADDTTALCKGVKTLPVDAEPNFAR